MRCELDCRATLVARGKPHTERLVLTLPATPLRAGNWWKEKRRQTMALPSDALTRLSPGQIDMVVKIDGREAARREITVRATQ